MRSFTLTLKFLDKKDIEIVKSTWNKFKTQCKKTNTDYKTIFIQR